MAQPLSTSESNYVFSSTGVFDWSGLSTTEFVAEISTQTTDMIINTFLNHLSKKY